ncbi:hypothetical protein QJQ45_015858 [Haematococcus lacustris]|nr:hypothetical protein QJQ45_015858 [Haematococcus lacustris]
MRWSTVPGGHGRVSLKRYGRPKQLVVCTQPLNTILSGPTDMEALVRDEGDCYHTTPMPGRIGPKKRIDSYECQDKENTAPLQAGASNVKATAAKVTPSRLDRINDLKEELTCSICLELCTRPCTVPCGFPLKINTALWNTIQLLFPSTVQNACANPATPEAVLQAALDLMPAAMPAAALRTRLPESLANPFRQPRAGGVASQARHAVPATSHMWQPEMALRPHGVTGNGLASAAGSGALVGTGAGGAGLTQGAAARNRIVEQHPPPSRLESLLHTVQLPTVRQTLTQPATQRQPRPLHHQTDSSQPANMNNPFARQASTASQRPLMQLGPSAVTLQQLSGHRLDEDLPATLRMQPDTEVIELSSDAEQGSESDSEHDGFTTASDSGSEGSEARPDDDDLGLSRTIRRLTDMSLQVTPAPGSTLRQAAARAMAELLPQSTPGVPVTPLALHTQLAHVAHQPQDASPQFMVPATSGSHLLGWQPGADSASSDEDMVPGTTQGLAEAAASIGRQARSPFSPVLQLLASTMAMGSNARPSTSHVVASPLWQNAHGTAGAPLTLAAVPEVYLQPEHLPDTSSDQSCHRVQQPRQATRTPSASTPMHSSRGTSRSGTHSPQLLAANDLHHHLRDQHDPPYQAARVADDPPPAAHQLPASPQPDPLSPTGLGTLAASAFTPMVQSMQAAGEVAAQGTPSSATGAATAHPAGQEGVSAASAPSSSQEWEGAGLPCSSAAGYAAWRRPSAASTLPSQLDDSDSSGSLEIVEGDEGGAGRQWAARAPQWLLRPTHLPASSSLAANRRRSRGMPTCPPPLVPAAAAAAQSGSVCHGGGLTQELGSWGTTAAALVESSEHDDMIGSMGQLSMCSDPSQPTPAVQVFGDTIAAAGTGQQRQALLRAARARTAAAGAERGSAAGEQPGMAAAASLQGTRPPNPPLAEHPLHSGTSAVPASAEGAQQRGPPAPSGLTVAAAAVAAAGPDQEARRSPEGTAADMITLLSSSDDLSEQLPTRSRRSQRGSQARRQEFQLGTAAQQQVPQQQAQQQQGVQQEQAAGPGARQGRVTRASLLQGPEGTAAVAGAARGRVVPGLRRPRQPPRSLLTDLPTLLATYGLLPILRSLNRLNLLCQSRAIFVEDLMQEVALTANKITAMYSGPSPFSALDFPELTAFTNVAGPGSCLVYNGSGHLALQPHGSGSMTVQSDEADSDSEDEEEVGSRQAAADMETTFGENEEEEEGSELGSEPVQLYAIPPSMSTVPSRSWQQQQMLWYVTYTAASSPPEHAKGLAVVYAHYWDKQPSDEDFLERLAIVKARYCMDATLANGHSAAANPAKETTKLWRYLAGQPITKADILEYIMTPGLVEEERMFSAMAYLKDDTRNRLQECHLNVCARVFSSNQFDLDTFPDERAISKWLDNAAVRVGATAFDWAYCFNLTFLLCAMGPNRVAL